MKITRRVFLEGTLKAPGLILSLLLCATMVVGKEITVRKSWVRNFPNTSLEIMPDNLGCIAAVGNDTNSAIALLLNTRGRQVAKASVPITGGVTAAVADRSGRIFIAGNQTLSPNVYCAAFAPSLSQLLWAEENNPDGGYALNPSTSLASIAALTPDERGAVYLTGNYGEGESFLTQFLGDNAGSPTSWWPELDSRSQNAATVVRSPTGDIYFVGTTFTLPKYPWITVLKYSPATGELLAYDTSTLYQGYVAIATAAACDAEGNLIIVGQYSEDAQSFYRSGRRCLTIKMDPQLNVLWKALHGPVEENTIARTLTVDRSDNIIMTGTAGTVKYAGDGRVLWASSEAGTTLRLDDSGNVLLSQIAGREDGKYESEITKLNADGSRRWQTRFHDGSLYDNRPAGLMSDKEGNVYFAATTGEQTTIVKFIERATLRDKRASR